MGPSIVLYLAVPDLTFGNTSSEMQLAINVSLFFLGLCIATVLAQRSYNAGKSIPATLRQILTWLATEQPLNNQDRSIASSNEEQEHDLLLTK